MVGAGCPEVWPVGVAASFRAALKAARYGGVQRLLRTNVLSGLPRHAGAARRVLR
jgi:hypothetical protein